MARQKEFEPQSALIAAMTLFWRNGYEKTSIGDLTTAMGVGRRSLYDTFGDKRELYLRALQRYSETIEADQRREALAQPTARGGLRSLLESAIVEDGSKPPGCLIVNCATEIAPTDTAAADRVDRSLADARRLLIDLIERGQRDGEFDPHLNVITIASSLLDAWIGLRVRARAGLSPTALHAAVEDLMSLLV